MTGRVLITGAASGLGAALAAQCSASGSVCALDLSPLPAPVTRQEWIVHDMADPDPAIWAQLGKRLAQQGPFDLVILNAGISATGRFEGIALPTHQAVIHVNLLGPMRLTQMLVADGLLAPGARLIFVASLSCFTGYPGAASYGASKDGLASFARALRKPLRRAGLHVQLVCPGPMDTPHAAQHAPEGARADRRLPPEIVAHKILAAPSRKFLIVPGTGAAFAAALGRAFPQTMTRIMGKILFRKLQGKNGMVSKTRTPGPG